MGGDTPGLRLKRRGKDIKCENTLGRYSHISCLFLREVRYSQALAPDKGGARFKKALNIRHSPKNEPNHPAGRGQCAVDVDAEKRNNRALDRLRQLLGNGRKAGSSVNRS